MKFLGRRKEEKGSGKERERRMPRRTMPSLSMLSLERREGAWQGKGWRPMQLPLERGSAVVWSGVCGVSFSGQIQRLEVDLQGVSIFYSLYSKII